ncbi:MAG: polyamine aminopropyltransferase [Micavibrio sp.]|nr:polyamine aminopropyltransferase [Micavibrio sp.]
MANLLLISVIVIATCGLVYELIAGTAASYLLGDSITQFSTVIGSYLFAMGIGSWLTKYLHRNLIGYFIRVEILVGVVGGCSAMALLLLFDHVFSFRFLLYFIVSIIGVLVGIEIPLLLRILKDRFEFKDLVSRVLAFDYLGALFASVLFPMVLVPYLGLVKSSFLFGMLNISVAIWVLYALNDEIPSHRAHKLTAILAMVGLTFGFIYSDKIMSIAEGSAYQGHVIFSQSTPYQRIVITRTAQDLRLFLNSNLQFSSVDEYRYHEALVHPVMAALENPRNILIIGGGDGLALREILKYPAVEHVTMVDLDPAMTKLFSSNEMLTSLNGKSLLSPKLTVINQDAFVWIRQAAREEKPPVFDAVFIDVPDPSNYSIGKLYSTTFYNELKGVLNDKSLVVVQSTSPLIARKSFWCVDNTMAAVGLKTAPFHVYVPSFGEWGFVIGSLSDYKIPGNFPAGLRYVTPRTVQDMFYFAPDMAHVDTKIQRLDDQALVRYFDQEWSEYLIY